MEVTLKDAIKAGDSVSMFVEGATDPRGRNVNDFDVYTTGAPIAMVAAPYNIDSVATATRTGCLFPPAEDCYSPQALRTAYGIAPLLARGIDGRGRTIVLIEWLASAAGGPASSNIFQDMAGFDSYFHLPPVKLSVVHGAEPKASVDLAISEEVIDVELVHAVAPGAAIRVVLTGPRTYSSGAVVSDLGDVLAASRGADVVSMSGGAWRTASPQPSWPRRTRLSASWWPATSRLPPAQVTQAWPMRVGPVPKRGVQYPASDPLVLGVGGTKLVANPKSGSYISETAWNSPNHATSGGFSSLFAAPVVPGQCP